MTDKKIVKNLVLHQEGKHLPDGLYQQLADEIGSVIDQEIDEVVEKLSEDPYDVVITSTSIKQASTEYMHRYLIEQLTSEQLVKVFKAAERPSSPRPRC